jgi:hypothetical protein
MQIVIDIEDGRYNWIMSHASNDPGDYANSEDLFFRKAVESGTVLPKGHGDLIDRDKLEKDTEWSEYEDGFISYTHLQIFDEPVVIPADKGD